MKIKKIVSVMERNGWFMWLPSDVFLMWKYKRITGNKLDLENPRSFNEKLQWLKLYNARHPNPMYTKLADKYAVKEIVGKIIGDEYIVPTLMGGWKTVDEIPFDQLPSQFVLKTNHDSGGVVVVKDKDKMDLAKIRSKLNKSMKRNFYWYGREPQYKDIPPTLFAEKYIEIDERGMEEYKLFCFNGEVKCILICRGEAHRGGRTNDYMDRNFEHFPFTSLNPCSKEKVQKPAQMDEMIALAEKLAGNLPQVRVDFYLAKDHIYFGEMTFFHNSGFQKFNPREWEYKFGEWINLPNE